RPVPARRAAAAVRRARARRRRPPQAAVVPDRVRAVAARARRLLSARAIDRVHSVAVDEGFHPFERAVEDWHWWYQVRREILDLHLSRLRLDPARALLLDIGCGTGGSSLVMAR